MILAEATKRIREYHDLIKFIRPRLLERGYDHTWMIGDILSLSDRKRTGFLVSLFRENNSGERFEHTDVILTGKDFDDAEN